MQSVPEQHRKREGGREAEVDNKAKDEQQHGRQVKKLSMSMGLR